MSAKIICCEGIDGAGKSTQVELLVSYLQNKGFKVFQTKEPGSFHSPLTMKLRTLMLDAQYEGEMTIVAREMISQAIRSVHLEKVIKSAIEEYDYIIQDRGALSGYAYAMTCGVHPNDIEMLFEMVLNYANFYSLYSSIVFLNGDPEKLLVRARNAKQEFAAGDAIEAKGVEFAKQVAQNFTQLLSKTSLKDSLVIIDVEEKTQEQVFEEIKTSLNMG